MNVTALTTPTVIGLEARLPVVDATASASQCRLCDRATSHQSCMLWLRCPGLARDLDARGCAFHVCNEFAPYCHYLAGRDSALRFTEPDTSDRLVDRAQRKAVSKS